MDCHVIDEFGLAWIEEQIVYDNLDGYIQLAAELKTPIQIGENFYGPRDLHKALQSKACDYVMPDFMRIGGVTGWLRAAAIAGTAGVPMSSHVGDPGDISFRSGKVLDKPKQDRIGNDGGNNWYPTCRGCGCTGISARQPEAGRAAKFGQYASGCVCHDQSGSNVTCAKPYTCSATPGLLRFRRNGCYP